jgi:hypothetical protein
MSITDIAMSFGPARKTHDIPVKCCRCRHQCMESEWLDKPKPLRGGGISLTEKGCLKCGCKSYYDMSPQVAWCWASGLIEIGDNVPEKSADGSGAIVIATGPKFAMKAVLSVVARHGQGASEGQLIVPGVPEADSQDQACDALSTWLSWCANGNGRKQRYGVQFVTPPRTRR